MTDKSPSAWTQPKDLKSTLRRRWKQGIFLRAMVEDELENLFPYRLPLKKPGSAEVAEHFDEVRNWILSLALCAHIRIEYRNFNHRILGNNSLPDAAWVDSIGSLAAFIGCHSEFVSFCKIHEITRMRYPKLLPWLGKQPLQAIRYSEDWSRLLSVVDWLSQHTRPGIYLRQMDLPGVHTKFVERHRKLLSELLDLSLPDEAFDHATTNFQNRYGFLNKPERIRFRFLDLSCNPYPPELGTDLQIDSHAFARLDPKVSQVFITENEINYLAFPDVPGSLVLFGSGYGFENLREAHWLTKKRLHYWGDIDTHGFAILDQFRKQLPQTESLLMDEETLLTFRSLWGTESTPTRRELSHLNPSESKLYQELLAGTHAPNLRLEQERIGFDWLNQYLASI